MKEPKETDQIILAIFFGFMLMTLIISMIILTMGSPISFMGH